jgi:acyl carrier protein
MHTKDEIFYELKNVLIELFEIDESLITLDVKLYEELDLDSIDAIDMIVKLQKMTGKKVKPEDFKSVRTVQDVVDVVYRMIHEKG